MEMVAAEMALRLKRLGNRVFFLGGDDTPATREMHRTGVEVLPFSLDGYFHRKTFRELRGWLGSSTLDVIHAHYSRDLWMLVPALGKFRHLPLVLTKHIGTQKAKKDPLHRYLYSRVDAVVAISKIIQRNVRKTHPLSPEKVVHIPNAVDVGHFHFSRESREKTRARYGIPSDAMVIGIMGRLIWWKGYREFIEMAGRVHREYPDVWFLAVGDNSRNEEKEAQDIRTFAAGFEWHGKFLFTGFQQDVQPFLSAMDLFVYPAYAEAFGMVLIEAMSVGLPVVASGSDAIPEIVRHGRTGRLVTPRDSNALSEAVLDAVRYPAKRNKWGIEGQKWAHATYEAGHIMELHLKLYNDLIRRRKSL